MRFYRLWCCCAGVALELLAVCAHAEPGADFDSLKSWLSEHNPELAAMNYDVEAARARADGAGKLPDPMVRGELMEIESVPGRAEETRFLISQTFPLGGKRALRERAAATDVEVAKHHVLHTRAELIAELRMAYAEYFVARESRTINDGIMELLQGLESAAASRYAQGDGTQQDVLRLRSEQTELRAGLIDLEGEQARWRYRLNALLGRDPQAPLAEPAVLPALPESMPDREEVQARLHQHSPLLAAGADSIAAAETRKQLADREWIPDLNIGMGPVFFANQRDSWQIMAEVNLPLGFERRRALQREASAMQNQARSQRDADALRLSAELDAAITAYTQAQARERLNQESLLPQTELTLRSALAGYASGQVDFSTVVDAERSLRTVRLESLRTRNAQQAAFATIERLTGESQ